MVRVLVCDPHSAIHEALSKAFLAERDIKLVGVSFSLDDALSMVTRNIDVLTLELALQGTYALDQVHGLVDKYSELHVVIYSMYDERIYAERALRAGASAYVMKTEPTSVVVDAIRTVARGEVYLSPSFSSNLLMRLRRDERPRAHHFTAVLTDREMAVFQLLGEGLDVETIAYELHLSRKTVEAYRRRAKNKLGFRNISELLQYAVRSTQA